MVMEESFLSRVCLDSLSYGLLIPALFFWSGFLVGRFFGRGKSCGGSGNEDPEVYRRHADRWRG